MGFVHSATIVCTPPETSLPGVKKSKAKQDTGLGIMKIKEHNQILVSAGLWRTGVVTMLPLRGAMLAAGLLFALLASAAGKTTKYQLHDPVPVVANKVSRFRLLAPSISLPLVLQVGPLSNPTEIYQYYSLPFCAPASLKRESHDVGQYLAGDRRVNTPYDVRFKVSEEWRELCNVELSNEDVQRLIEAIDEVRSTSAGAGCASSMACFAGVLLRIFHGRSTHVGFCW